MKTLTIKVSDALFYEIQEAAEARKISKSEIIRERIEQHSLPKQSLWNRMKDLVIDDDSLPWDLSTNKSYFVNYGKNHSDR